VTRDEMIGAVSKLEPIELEYYIDSTETDDHPSHSDSWCFKHADMVARVEALLVGAEMLVTGSWSEVDGAPRCMWRGCGVALRSNGGGLTSYGVDSALGLTETDPRRCHVYPAELVLSAQSMSDDDPRWELWEFHARRLLRRKRAA
jgi:hypothetical protein